MKKWPVLLLLVFGVAHAQAQSTLKAGAPAPQITITEWLLNTPADTSLAGKFIVLESHLNELQARFASPDLRFYP